MKKMNGADAAAATKETPHRTGSGGRARHKRVIGFLAATALATPGILLGAMPARAADCYAYGDTPEVSHFNSAGKMVINYRVHVSCSKERDIHIEQKRYEEDTFSDDYLGGTYWVEHILAGEKFTLNNYRSLVDTEDGAEELYQQTRYRVGSDGVWSPWSNWGRSYVIEIIDF